jgi:soluble lytic murein transglycosylase
MDEHGQSLILTFAAYNAGGHRVKQWIAAYGDPRKSDVDPIDWVERIPFTETRNYVQRVVENVGVYRARFGAPDAKGLIVDDLRARQVRLAASQ